MKVHKMRIDCAQYVVLVIRNSDTYRDLWSDSVTVRWAIGFAAIAYMRPFGLAKSETYSELP